MSRHQRAKQARYEDGKGNAETPVWGANALAQLGEPFGKELTNFNLEQVFQDGNGAVQGIVLNSRFLLILNYLKKSETFSVAFISGPGIGFKTQKRCSKIGKFQT